MSSEVKVSRAVREYTEYYVEIDADKMAAITEAEEEDWIDPEDHLDTLLVDEFCSFHGRPIVEGVSQVIYDGNDDGSLRYRVDFDFDTDELHERISEILKAQAIKAVELVNANSPSM